MDRNGFVEFVARQRWTFAKTYAEKAPHEYVVRGKLNATDEEFVDAAKFVDGNGFVAKFWGQKNSYYELDGYYYWTGFRRPETSMIINRCDKRLYELIMVRADKG